MAAPSRNVLADVVVSVSELRRSPTSVMSRANGAPIAVLSNNRVVGYMVPAEAFEALLDALDDADLARIVRARAGEVPVKVSLDAL